MTDSKDYFNRHADVFSAQYSTDRPDFVERVAVWSQAIDRYLKPEMPVIDLGCGDGTLSRIVAQSGNECVGIDQSPKMIELARALAQKQGLSPLLHYEIATLPYLNNRDIGRFGLLLCSSVLEYVSALEPVVQSFSKLARPDAILLVSFPNRSALYRRYERLKRILPMRRNDYLKYQQHTLNEHEAKVLLQKCGFITEEVHYYGRPPMPFLFEHGSDRDTKTLFLVVARRDDRNQ